MGLKFEDRHGKPFYQQHLRKEHLEMIDKLDNKPSLIELLNLWLERMPFFNEKYWPKSEKGDDIQAHPFWTEYIIAYKKTLGNEDNADYTSFTTALFSSEQVGRLSTAANRSALFILLYRDFPLLQIPYQMLETLINIDNLMSTWRTRHIAMVRRMIGGRAGTGGSTGAKYLQESRDKHFIYAELASLNSFLINRNNIPDLPISLKEQLGFRV